MFKKVPNNVSYVDLEHEMLRFWDERAIFDKLRNKNEGKPPWSFLDGPITANNPMGVHHAWGRTYKDCFQRFFAMNGHELRYQNGFDCQGLWVEVEVEKELGFKSKRDIESFGLENFVNKCKERVLRFAAIQTKQSIRLGYWMDWDNSYYTMTDENNYTIWTFLKKCHNRGLIYRGKDSMPWCPRCGTGISQHEMHEGYHEVTEDSVIARLPIVDREGEYLLVWTTTPWTLAANVACAVNPELTYIKARQNDEIYYLAESCEAEMKSRGQMEITEKLPGSKLVGLKYCGPFDELTVVKKAGVDKAHRVVAWDFVTGDEGTGIVHIAPGCGKEDYDLSREEGLAVLAPIDESGVYMKGYDFLTGKHAHEVAQDVFDSLREKGLYYKKEPYTHSYPHCWRCATPLLFRNVEEWYIDMSWREEIAEIAKKIRWIPDWGLERELDWLENMRDWMISKKRYWGLALPIFLCDCGWFEVVGGKEELREKAVEGWEEFDGHSPHRPWIDNVKIRCDKCGETVSRIPDVGNPWLDAGIVPYSTVKYNADREYWKKWVPADLVTECFPGQFRNWFYALLAMSAMMENIEPFRTLLGHALVRDENGDEMHKSTGNVIWFEDAAEKMGCDIMRWIYCRHNPTQNLNFGYTIGDQVKRGFFNTLWNVYSFFCNYARLDGFDPSVEQIPAAERPDIDRWLLSDLQLLARAADKRMRDFDVAGFIREAERFVDDLSNWYVRRNRRRFWRAKEQGDRDKLAAYQTLYETLVTLCRLFAPVIPFVTEVMYSNLVAERDESAPESVHLSDYPQEISGLVDERLSRDMAVVTEAVSAALGIRKEKQIRVRQPVGELTVVTHEPDSANALKRFESQVLDELNVKKLTVTESAEGLEKVEIRPRMDILGPKFRSFAGRVANALKEMAPQDVAEHILAGESVALCVDGQEVRVSPEEVEVRREMPEHLAAAEIRGAMLILDVEITDELLLEGLARDTVRQIQQLRKDLDMNIEDRISLRFEADSDELARAIREWREYIAAETLSVSFEEGIDGKEHRSVEIGGANLKLAIEKA